MDLSDDERECIKRIAEYLEHDPHFSETDVRIIHEMIGVYTGLRAWGRMARFIIIALAALAAAITAWDSIAEKVRTWFSG